MSADNERHHHHHHRGPHPTDRRVFAPECTPALRQAARELSWLLGRGYAVRSSLKLVGDRHSLNERGRLAVSRAACAEANLRAREAQCLPVESVKGKPIIIDGFNLLITIEAALGGGLVIICLDGCIRDLSSVHGSYRRVIETEQALGLIGTALAGFDPASVTWLLDRPVSNSGRLAERIRELARERGWPWTVEAVFNPDKMIVSSCEIAVTSDSTILDGGVSWINLSRHLIERFMPQVWLIDLRE